MGEDDIGKGKTEYSKSVRCKSLRGELLQMRREDFLNRVKGVSEEGWKRQET